MTRDCFEVDVAEPQDYSPRSGCSEVLLVAVVESESLSVGADVIQPTSNVGSRKTQQQQSVAINRQIQVVANEFETWIGSPSCPTLYYFSRQTFEVLQARR